MQRNHFIGRRGWPRGPSLLAALVLATGIASSAKADFPELLLPPEGLEESTASAINVHGEVTGSVGDFDRGKLETQIAAVWDEKGRVIRIMPPLPLPGHHHSEGRDINKKGVVAGISGEFFGVFDPIPVLWDQEGKATPLQPLPGDTHGIAAALNDLGQVVGESSDRGARLPVIWDGTAVPRALPLPKEAEGFGYAFDINNRGEILGESRPGSIKWDIDGAPKVLQPLPGFDRANAHAIGRYGLVVGTSVRNGGEESLATKWTRRGTIKSLPPLPGDHSSLAVAVNRFATVLGVSIGGTGRDRVTTIVTWDRKGRPTPHPKLRTFDAGFPIDIRDNGEFIGRHSRADDIEIDKYTFMGTLWHD